MKYLQTLVDSTASLFKGEMGTIYEIEHNYSLKELAQYRDIRIERLKKEQEAAADARKNAEKDAERRRKMGRR